MSRLCHECTVFIIITYYYLSQILLFAAIKKTKIQQDSHDIILYYQCADFLTDKQYLYKMSV